jgi:hypothetical protein
MENNLNDFYVSQKVLFKNRICYILNIFLNGKMKISPKNSDKEYTVHFSEVKKIENE